MTSTSPVSDATVYVLLPEGQSRQYCVGLQPSCIEVQWVNRTLTDERGRHSFHIEDPAHCGLRVRAYDQRILLFDLPSGEEATVTAPSLATVCEVGGSQEGPTLILEEV